MFGAKRDEVTGEWRNLHNTELRALYSSPDIIRNIKSRRLRWAGHVAHMGEFRNAYSVLVGRPEGKRPLGRSTRRWEDNIKMDLSELGYDGREWINLARDRDRWRAYVRAAMNLRHLIDEGDSWRASTESYEFAQGGKTPNLPGFSKSHKTAPRFTQPPIKLSTGSFRGKGGQSVMPTTPPHSSAECRQEFNQTHYNECVAVPNNCPWNTLIPAASLDPLENGLDTVNYYAKYYGKIMEVIDALDSTDSSAVAAVISLPSEQLFELISEKVKVKCKLRNIIAKNSAYSQLRIINDVLSGRDKTSEVGVLKSSDFPFFKYAPITSCVVERTFSQDKNCLSDHRRRFTLQSLKMYVTLHCNAHIKGL
ncbi:hypothetical protein ANN_22939 [Periplaneta americana]|uniref:Uncharacterized protein n=1 Tax=Periplaneta americana TaxID=6978 RepID=A0ABQ8SJP4_PERAM|nr:hypothetical protein ANN_22939 [Periplaneta americana]